MDSQAKLINELIKQVNLAKDSLNISSQQAELEKLNKKSLEPNFWQNNVQAQATMQKIAKLDSLIRPWQDLSHELAELKQLSDLKDHSLKEEITKNFNKLEGKYNDLKHDLKFSGPYDRNAAILSIYAGAGGTDAQDWTQMLFRMYSRWSQNNGYKIHILAQSPGEEAGLKSITAEIDGDLAYGKLKNENGIHRLVRLSPFNADNLRQTSFAKVEVLPKIDQPEDIDLDDKDLKIDVFRSGG